MVVDAHCHLGAGAFDHDRAEVVARAAAAGVGHIVVIGETLAAGRRALELARGTPGLSATAGVHPHEAKDWSADAERALRELLAAPEMVAVGETGLDYHYDHSPRPAQREAFEAQLAIAADIRKPVVVHAREADDDLAAIMREWSPRLPAVILHSFSGGDTLSEAGLETGAYFSFSGMITFKNWRWPLGTEVVPIERLLVETDAPYLAPVPHRGKRNEPTFVRQVAEALARARGMPAEALEGQLMENAQRVFGAGVATPL